MVSTDSNVMRNIHDESCYDSWLLLSVVPSALSHILFNKILCFRICTEDFFFFYFFKSKLVASFSLFLVQQLLGYLLILEVKIYQISSLTPGRNVSDPLFKELIRLLEEESSDIIPPMWFCLFTFLFYIWASAYDRGVQTDNNTEFSTSDIRNVCCSSKKLFDLWKSDADKLGSALVVDLFVTCEANFHVLFGYLKAPQVDSNMTLLDQPCPTQPIGCAKVSHLYSVLTKVNISEPCYLDEWIFSFFFKTQIASTIWAVPWILSFFIIPL